MGETDEAASVRDHLALDRTLLANERTLLAYARTALALAGAGAVVIRFFEGLEALLGGWGLIVLGIGVAVLGVWRFLRMQAHINGRCE